MNKKNIKVRIESWFILSVILYSISCTDQRWNDYYAKPDFTSASTYDVLSKNTDYRVFTELLVKSGCDSVLKSGGNYTVLAVKNEALASIDPNMQRDKLKELMGMHITSSALYSPDMKQANMPAISGKMLYFRGTTSNSFSVNDVALNAQSEIRTLNGVIYNVDKPIDAYPNLYQIIESNPDLTKLNDLIQKNKVLLVDPKNNTLIGYDAMNKPIYEEPITYTEYSEFLNSAQPDNELIQTTAFFPSNDAVKKGLDAMLAAKGGNLDLIIPRLRDNHQDTIVAGRYFKLNQPYAGDTTVFLNQYFSHSMVRGMIPSLSGTQTLTDINDRPLTVSSGNVKSSVRASNGYCHIMNEVEAPAIFGRNQFWFIPYQPTQVNASGVMQYVRNPNITFRNGAQNNPAQVVQTLCYTGFFIRLNFQRVGGAMDFTFPKVTPGAYDVYVSYFSDNNNIGLFDISYGQQVLVRNLNTSGQYNSRKLLCVRIKIGTIHVNQTGPVAITYVCVNTNPITTEQFQFCMDYMMLDPVDE